VLSKALQTPVTEAHHDDLSQLNAGAERSSNSPRVRTVPALALARPITQSLGRSHDHSPRPLRVRRGKLHFLEFLEPELDGPFSRFDRYQLGPCLRPANGRARCQNCRAPSRAPELHLLLAAPTLSPHSLTFTEAWPESSRAAAGAFYVPFLSLQPTKMRQRLRGRLEGACAIRVWPSRMRSPGEPCTCGRRTGERRGRRLRQVQSAISG